MTGAASAAPVSRFERLAKRKPPALTGDCFSYTYACSEFLA